MVSTDGTLNGLIFYAYRWSSGGVYFFFYKGGRDGPPLIWGSRIPIGSAIADAARSARIAKPL